MRLRPSMRENYRYILARIAPGGVAWDAREVYLAASEAITSLLGDAESSRAWVAVMEAGAGYAIFRYRRGLDESVEAALAGVSAIGGRPAAVHPLRISGTIRTLREQRQRILTSTPRPGRVRIQGGIHEAEIFPSGQIDLKEKGINLQIPLYITEEDIEDRYYDE